MKTPALSSWKIIVLVLCAGIVCNYAPVFTGRIPFPTLFVYEFAAFQSIAPPDLNQQVANIGDVASSFYPYRTLASSVWRDGFPLWDPYMQSGTPFLANPQSALFYPPNFLYYVLPVPVAWCIGFLLRPLFAGLFTALLLRRIGSTTAGAAVAGFLFAFSGFLTVWQGQAMADAAVWLPLICYAVVRLHQTRSALAVAIAAVAFAMPVLAGHPETAAHLTAMGVALALFLTVLRPDSGMRRRPLLHLLLFAAAGTLAIGLAAVQIVPTMEWLPLVHRGFDVVWPPAPLWAALGVVSRDILRSSNSFGLDIPEQAAYIGMFAFLAVPLACFHDRKRYVVFFALSTAVAFCIVYGVGPIYPWSRLVPAFHSLKNHRLILVVTFGVAVLAGLGTSALERMKRDRSLRARAGAFAATGFCLAALLIYVVRLYTFTIVESSRLPRVSFFFLVASAIVVAAGLAGLPGSWFARVAVVLAAADVCSFAYGFVPFDKPRNVFPPNEVFTRLAAKGPEPARVMQLGDAYLANSELVYKIPNVGGYEIPLTRLKNFVSGITRDEMDSVTMDSVHALDAKDRRIDMLNGRYYVVPRRDPLYKAIRERSQRFKLLFEYGDTGVFENLTALPPAFLVPSSGVVVVPDENRQLELIRSPDFDPERTVLVREPLSLTSAGGSRGTVSWIARSNTSFRLKVDNSQESVLLISQTFFPGWRAWVDGREARVFAADYALTGIAVGPGSHDVVFSFDPSTFKIGLALTGVTLVVLTLLFWKNTRRSNATLLR